MPSHQHVVYRESVLLWFRQHGHEPGVRETLSRFGLAALVLWHLDLEPARPFLLLGYAKSSRGGNPWDPIILFRCLLLSILVGTPKINPWTDQLQACRVLQVLAGVHMDPRKRKPGVGTFYGFLHRIHDGASRWPCPHGIAPSEAERRRCHAPRTLKSPKLNSPKRETKAQRRRRQKRQAKADRTTKASVTAKLVSELKETQTQPNPSNMLDRLAQILLQVGVMESARRGLLGDLRQLKVCGDGSPLPTGASREGKRTCDCPKNTRCDCPRLYSDPDAKIGYDSHRECYFFGHRIYELITTSKGGHDLPLYLRVDPGNTSDYVAVLKAFESLRKLFRDHSDFEIAALILDAGHDGIEIYRFLLHHDVTPVIPLQGKAPACHPSRPEIQLSRRAVPLCPAGVEMIHRGTNGKDGQVFGCPVKAGKKSRCPQAPEGAQCYSCRPVQQHGHTVVIKTSDNERLFAPIPRNHPQYRKLMNLRSGSERSFSVKKEPFKLLAARHRRASFWTIRAYLMAVLQHAQAWVTNEDADELVEHLLGRQPDSIAA